MAFTVGSGFNRGRSSSSSRSRSRSSSRGNYGPVNDSRYSRSSATRRSSRAPGGYSRGYQPSPTTRRGNYTVSRTGPPAGGWMNTSIRTTPGRNNRPSSSSGGSRGSSGGSSGGSRAPQSFTPPRPPAPPKPRKLSYQQLLAMIKNDPNLVAQLGSYGRFRKLSQNQATANKGLIDADYQGELSALERQTDETRRLAEEEAAAAGRIRSNPYSRRLSNINTGFEEGRGRLQRQRTAGRTGIEQALQSALEGFTLNENNARQNAINRLLSSRTDIARGY